MTPIPVALAPPVQTCSPGFVAHGFWRRFERWMRRSLRQPAGALAGA